MNRRKFLKFAGIAGGARAFFGSLPPALAQTWQKISNPSGSSSTWQKLTVASTTTDLRIASITAG
jgi:hypothetical protein